MKSEDPEKSILSMLPIMELRRAPGEGILPTEAEILDIVGLEHSAPGSHIFRSPLMEPLERFFSHQGKLIRSDFVDFGFRTFSLNEPSERQKFRMQHAANLIEALHCGSMVIDDIEDSSLYRRGQPALYVQYGLPVALNAANWLMFRALDQLPALELDPVLETALHRFVNRILVQAHFGQAVDVGVKISNLPQTKVAETCLTIIELKTGALMTLAFNLGAALSNQMPSLDHEGSRFARRFGMTLQMLDDLQNLKAPPPKGLEDLRNDRGSFIWMVAARTSSPEDFSDFISAVKQLPDETPLQAWLAKHDLTRRAQKIAHDFLYSGLEDWRARPREYAFLESLCKKLESAYEI